MKKIIFPFIFFSLFSLAHAGVYSWVDKDGVKHFGDAPPQDTIAQEQEEIKSTYIQPRQVSTTKNRTTIDRDQKEDVKENHETEKAEIKKQELRKRVSLEKKTIQERYKKMSRKCSGGTGATCGIRAREWYNREKNLLKDDPELYFYNLDKEERDTANSEEGINDPVNQPQILNKNINNSAYDQHGTFYAPAGRNLIDSKTGTLLIPTNNGKGYIDTKTGRFIPSN